MFKRGTPQGLIGLVPAGGQDIPISSVGDSALWKNAQKKEKKNITSDAINKIKPILSPLTTNEVCIPKNVASRTTSRHQKKRITDTVIKPKVAVNIESPWNHETNPVVVTIAPMAAPKGQGLRSTIW